MSVLMFILDLVEEFIFSAFPAIGFGILFNVPRRALLYCGLLGGGGHVLRTLLMLLALNQVLATFIAATTIGFVGIYIAKKLHSHPKVFTVAAIIPMFPGLYAYHSIIILIQINGVGYSMALNGELVTSFLNLFFQLGALAAGLALPGLLFYRRRSII